MDNNNDIKVEFNGTGEVRVTQVGMPIELDLTSAADRAKVYKSVVITDKSKEFAAELIDPRISEPLKYE